MAAYLAGSGQAVLGFPGWASTALWGPRKWLSDVNIHRTLTVFQAWFEVLYCFVSYVVESDFAGGETEAQSTKCCAQVRMLLGAEFSPVGLLHGTIFSPIVTACSLCPQVQST